MVTARLPGVAPAASAAPASLLEMRSAAGVFIPTTPPRKLGDPASDVALLFARLFARCRRRHRSRCTSRSSSKMKSQSSLATLGSFHTSERRGGVERRQLEIGVHHADAVVWGPVYRTRLSLEQRPEDAAGGASTRAVRRHLTAAAFDRAHLDREVVRHGDPDALDRAAHEALFGLAEVAAEVARGARGVDAGAV
eukprot:31457-Pelagococcus_subviridis.AAC.21